MALKLALDAGLTSIVSGGNPITTEHPTTGSTVERQIWIFNDVSTKTYQTITIDPTDVTATDESGWLSLAPNNAGVAGTYVAAGAPLAIADIGASGSNSFWVKVIVPNAVFADSANKTDIQLTVAAKEYAV